MAEPPPRRSARRFVTSWVRTRLEATTTVSSTPSKESGLTPAAPLTTMISRLEYDFNFVYKVAAHSTTNCSLLEKKKKNRI